MKSVDPIPMDDFPILRTQRLHLREIVCSDAPALLAIYSDVDAMRWFGADPLADVQDAEKLVETFAGWRKAPNPGIRWAIIENETNHLMGTCGLFRWNRVRKSCSLGYELVQSAWGNGFMHEALSRALSWGFESMSLNRIEAQIHPENFSSIKLVCRLGFVREGVLRQAGFWLGEHRDLVQFSLLRAEYPQE
jgi:[ribosomal protein S5]-alanine N-acetyltransferase